MINSGRLRDLFLELVSTDSESRAEAPVARKLAEIMTGLGAAVTTDNAGDAVGGNTGNVICRLPGTATHAPPVFLCAHMDTVKPGIGVKPVVDGDIIRTDGTTILGGDDKAGCSIIVETIRALQENNLPYPDLEVIFTICEEVGLLGAKNLDVSQLRARTGFVLDADNVDTIFTRGPASNHMEWTITGLAAHAGVAPDKGLNAIKIASDAIAGMRLGRIDAQTTANIGVISGGLATNIVPERVQVAGETRSHSLDALSAQTEHMDSRFHDAAGRYVLTTDDGQTVTARVESHIVNSYGLLNVPTDTPILQMMVAAGRRIGREIRLDSTGGGFDANVLNQRGMQVVPLSTGMRAIHTVNEWIDVRDMVATAEVLSATLQMAVEA